MGAKQILIVEDENIIAQDLRKTIERFGHQVCGIVSTGISAVEKADELRPDLILMDIQLGNDMTGIEAAEQIKNILNIPLIYITAFADDSTLKKAKITEPFAYLLKPFEEKELKAAVEMAIYKSELEKEKQKTRNMFRMLVETMNDGLIIQDTKGFITYANYRFCRMMGFSQHEIIGEYYTKFLEKSFQQRYPERIEKWKKGYQDNYEQIFLRKDKKKIFTIVSPKPTFDDDGEYTGAFEVITDITEIKSAEEQIHRQNEFYKKTIESLTHPFLVIDAENYKIIIANSSAKKSPFFRYETCYHLNHNRKNPCPPETCPLMQMKKTLKPVKIIHQHYNKKNKLRLYEVHAFPIFDKKNNFVQMIEYTIDITEQKKMEKQLLRSERLAGVGELAAGIAHEIKNPLGNITFAAQYSLNEFKLKSELRQYLEIILRNSQNANQIIKDLLDFANPRELHLQPRNIISVIENAANMIKARCEQNKVTINKKYDRNIPEIKIDEKWMEQAFLNFLLNAIDAMPNGGTIEIAVANKAGKLLEITFADTGMGIPKENLKKIFDPFFTTKEKGVGLGLSLVYQIIRDHNGNLNLESKVGEGTKITVFFPIEN